MNTLDEFGKRVWKVWRIPFEHQITLGLQIQISYERTNFTSQTTVIQTTNGL